jgi:hypothetical protein
LLLFLSCGGAFTGSPEIGEPIARG